MLEKPPLPDDLLLDRVRAAYGLPAARLTFLPLGYDVNTAVYRLDDPDGRAFFLKLRKGAFAPLTVSLPRWLHAGGNPAVMAPLPARSGELWAELDPYRLILYPFVAGQDGYQRELSPAQWRDFGAALRAVHAADLPPELAAQLPREDFAPGARRQLRDLQALAASRSFAEPVAAQLADLMRARRPVIDHLLDLAGRLAVDLARRDLPFVLCHADLHPGNLLLAADGDLYLVDWDAPLFAPRERDLMAIGGGLGARWSRPEQIELFYRGYGPYRPDPAALTYYRCERIILDMVAFGRQLLLSTAGGADRAQSLDYFASNFLPGHEIEAALAGASALEP